MTHSERKSILSLVADRNATLCGKVRERQTYHPGGDAPVSLMVERVTGFTEVCADAPATALYATFADGESYRMALCNGTRPTWRKM